MEQNGTVSGNQSEAANVLFSKEQIKNSCAEASVKCMNLCPQWELRSETETQDVSTTLLFVLIATSPDKNESLPNTSQSIQLINISDIFFMIPNWSLDEDDFRGSTPVCVLQDFTRYFSMLGKQVWRLILRISLHDCVRDQQTKNWSATHNGHENCNDLETMNPPDGGFLEED